MKAEGAGRAINAALNPEPEAPRNDVGGLRRLLADLPADMPVRLMVQGSDTGPCILVGWDSKPGELMLIGAKVQS